jgi:hypothetical protein
MYMSHGMSGSARPVIVITVVNQYLSRISCG